MMSKGFLRPLEGADRPKAWEGERTTADTLEVYRQVVASPDMSLRLDDLGNGTMYLGLAEPGTSEAAPKWKIKQILTTGGQLSILWASGDPGYVHAWGLRASYSYS